MRKFVKNQNTGEFRQIVHCPERYGGDRWSFTSKALRCCRNDEYEYNNKYRKHANFVCKTCAHTARRVVGSRNAAICPKCRTEMAYWGMRLRIPSKNKLKKQLGIK